MFRLITWNVNSVRARSERLVRLIERHRPDALCLQELKTDDVAGVATLLAPLGYGVEALGQKTYNGVAIVSPHPIDDVVRGFGDGEDDPQSRFIVGTVRGVRVANCYVPNGQSPGSDKFAYKLRWLGRLRRWLEGHLDVSQACAITGDFNVAPTALDAFDDASADLDVLVHPEARAALADVLALGLDDAFRRLHPDEAALYSWWDYRQLAFPKNRGARIDHIFTTSMLTSRVTAARVDRDERKGEAPSDHAPVICDFQWDGAPAAPRTF